MKWERAWGNLSLKPELFSTGSAEPSVGKKFGAGICREGPTTEHAEATWRLNAENSLAELRKRDQAWPLPRLSWRILWMLHSDLASEVGLHSRVSPHI